MPDWTPTTADLADGDYPTAMIAARRGTDPSDLREVPLSRIAVRDINWFREFVFGMESPAISDEYFPPYVCTQKSRIPVNLAGSFVAKRPGGVNPAATWILRLFRNSTQIGTITISNAGVVTLATTGGTSYDLNPGDVLTAQAPSTADGSIRGWGFNITLLAIS